MSFSFSFTHEGIKHTVNAQEVSQPSEKVFSLAGHAYTVLGDQESLQLFQSYITTKKADFKDLSDLKTSLEGIGYEKTQNVFQKTLEVPPKISSWSARDEERLPEKRRAVAKALFDIFTKTDRDPSQLRQFLINTSPRKEETASFFDKGVQDFSLFIQAFNHLTTNEVHMINDAEGLNAISIGKVSNKTYHITENDLENLKKYMDETEFSGEVTISDEKGVHTVRSKKFDAVEESQPFCIHSLGKVFTGALGVLMIQEGVIDPKRVNEPPLPLDEKILKKLPEKVQEHIKTISLHEAMTHTAKLGDYLGNYQKAIEEALHEGKEPPSITSLSDFLQFADDHIEDNDYSNLGLLLTGLSLEHLYNEKYGTSLGYNALLKQYILDPLEITLFSEKPENGRYNEEDPAAPHIAASPSGGYWMTSQDLQKFGAWLNTQCQEEGVFQEFGKEFYDKERGEIAHSGFINSSSAQLTSFLDNGVTVTVVSDKGQLSAPRLCGAIIEHVLVEKD